MTDNKRWDQYLAYVLDKLRQRIARDIPKHYRRPERNRVCMNITGKITQKWTSMDMKILTISRRCFINQCQKRNPSKKRFRNNAGFSFWKSRFYF